MWTIGGGLPFKIMYWFTGSSDRMLFKVMKNDHVVVVYAHCCLVPQWLQIKLVYCITCCVVVVVKTGQLQCICVVCTVKKIPQSEMKFFKFILSLLWHTYLSYFTWWHGVYWRQLCLFHEYWHWKYIVLRVWLSFWYHFFTALMSCAPDHKIKHW